MDIRIYITIYTQFDEYDNRKQPHTAIYGDVNVRNRRKDDRVLAVFDPFGRHIMRYATRPRTKILRIDQKAFKDLFLKKLFSALKITLYNIDVCGKALKCLHVSESLHFDRQ